MSEVSEKPAIGTKEWQDFVLRNIDEEDMKNGKPTAAGLRKFVEREYGWIQSIDSEVISSSYKNAVVKVTVAIWLNEQSRHLSFSSCVECNPENTPEEFQPHAVASAETRALSRALKNLLCLNIYTHEEMESNEFTPTITNQQERSIRSLAKQKNINLGEFLAAQAGISEDMLSASSAAITKDKAHELIGLLNKS